MLLSWTLLATTLFFTPPRPPALFTPRPPPRPFYKSTHPPFPPLRFFSLTRPFHHLQSPMPPASQTYTLQTHTPAAKHAPRASPSVARLGVFASMGAFRLGAPYQNWPRRPVKEHTLVRPDKELKKTKLAAPKKKKKKKKSVAEKGDARKLAVDEVPAAPVLEPFTAAQLAPVPSAPDLVLPFSGAPILGFPYLTEKQSHGAQEMYEKLRAYYTAEKVKPQSQRKSIRKKKPSARLLLTPPPTPSPPPPQLPSLSLLEPLFSVPSPDGSTLETISVPRLSLYGALTLYGDTFIPDSAQAVVEEAEHTAAQIMQYASIVKGLERDKVEWLCRHYICERALQVALPVYEPIEGLVDEGDWKKTGQPKEYSGFDEMEEHELDRALDEFYGV